MRTASLRDMSERPQLVMGSFEGSGSSGVVVFGFEGATPSSLQRRTGSVGEEVSVCLQ